MTTGRLKTKKVMNKDRDATQRVMTGALRHKRQLVGQLEGTTKLRKNEQIIGSEDNRKVALSDTPSVE